MEDKLKRRLQIPAAQFLLGIAGVAAITYVCFWVGFGIGRTAFVYLILIALVSLLGIFSVSVVLSIIAVACLNYFFVPPLFEFRVNDPDDIVRLATFLATTLIVTALIGKLRKSEMRFRAFVDHATDAFFLLSDELIVLDANRQACVSLGYSREELIGMHPRDFDSALDEASIQHLRQRIAAGETVTFDTRHQRKDGTSFPVEIRAGQFEQGKRRFLCLVRDITERKRAEDELRASEARFRSFVDHATDGFFLFDEHQTLLDVNRQACESLGYSREQMIGMHLGDFDAALDKASIVRIGEQITAGETVTFETRHRRKDGTVFPVEVRARQFQHGTHQFRLSLARDISERKKAELSLRQRERELRGILETIPAMTVTVLPDGSNRYIGKRFSEYSGLSEEDGQGAGWKACVHPADLDLYVRKWRESLRSGDPIEVETRFRRADGEYRWFLARAAPLCGEVGEILKWYEVLTDIEDRKRAEEALRASQTKLEAAQRIAHVGWWERDFTTGQVVLSDEVCRTFGVQPLELPAWQERWLKLIHPDDRQRAAEAAAAARRSDARYDVEYRVVRPDGTVRIVHSQGDVTWDESGRPLRQFGVLQDITELRQTEKELGASEARFRTFVDHATDAFFLLDDDSTVLDVNRQACESLGYSRKELIGKHRSDFDVGLDETSIQDLKQRIVAGEATTFETHHRRKDGTSFPVEVRVSQFEQSGRRFLCLVRDITERKQAADELRVSEERFRTLVQFSFDVYWESDAQHRFIRQEFAESLADAPTPGFEIGKTRWEVPYLEPDAEAWRKHRDTLDAHLPFRDFELARPAPDGGKRYVSVSGLPFFDKTGRFIGYRGVGRHITDRKRTDEALRRSEAYLADAQRLSHTGTIVFNATGPVYWSEESYRIWELNPLQGLPDLESVLQRIHPDDREIATQETFEALRQNRKYAIEFRIVLPDGTVKHLESTGHPLLSADEEPQMIATLIDATERKRAQAQHERLRQLESDLAHVNRLSIMGELAASLAHEILHPIATARNNARAGMRFLELNPPNLGEVRDSLACIVRDADRAKDIVGRMRDHIKKAPPQRESFDLNEAIKEVIGMARNAIEKNRVSVRTSLMEGLNSVRGDRVQLQQVVFNLILNSVEAMSSVEKSARELSISTHQGPASNTIVAVQDSGPGIDPQHLDRIFAPFYTTKTSGIGMGLSICRSIIAAHGGRLWAEANWPRGAIFQFTLPAGLEDS